MKGGKVLEPFVTVLIPAYNEAATIATTVYAVWRIPEVGQVVVVDDGSTDETAIRARQAGAEVERLEKNQGKGSALNHGASRVKGSIVALVDADLGESAAEIAKLLAPVVAGEAEMAVARFPPTLRAGGFGLVKGLARRGIYWLARVEMRAPLSGQRVMTREVWEQVLPLEPGFGMEVGMTLRAARLGFRIREVDLSLTHRETGRDWSGFRHRGRQFYHVLGALYRGALEK